MKSKNSGKVLDVDNWSTADGAKVQPPVRPSGQSVADHSTALWVINPNGMTHRVMQATGLPDILTGHVFE